ncbi:alcohol acetyltransferase [Scheffersomyces xylosifermentans]|uniref:alcohol acetyltransferase n=1 Tax=Scheffersomyces xylosifermentans TaxID=1304137 RepID=UPI00315DC932
MVIAAHRRKLGFNERYYLCRGNEGYYTNFNITVTYPHRISVELLSNALKELITKNSWLSHNFFKLDNQDDTVANGHNYEVRYVDKIKFEDVVTFKNVDVFDGNVLSEINNITCPMNVELPLWRIVVLETSNGKQFFCGVFDHSIFDGMSGAQFMKDLTKELNTATEVYDEYLFDYERDQLFLPKLILPAVDTLTDLFKLSFIDIVKYYANKYLPNVILNFFTKLRNLVSPDPMKPNLGVNPVFKCGLITKDLRTNYRVLNFSNEQIEKVTQFCRSQDLTITPYFDIIAVKCLEETVYKAVDPSTEFSTINLVAVNGRRYYDHFENFLYGVMVCGDPILTPPLTSDLLSYMKYFHRTMMERIRTKSSFKLVGLYRFYNLWDFFKQKLNKADGRFTITISNLGKFVQPKGRFEVEEIYFGSNTAITYHFILNMSTSEKGGLNVVFGYLPEYDNLYVNDKKVLDIFFEKFYNMILEFPTQQ